MQFRLTVFANRNGKPCNPTPYKRTTYGAHWDKNYKLYTAWKHHVQEIFQSTYPKFYNAKYLSTVLRRKPIVEQGPWEVNIIVYFMDKTHGDTDNIAKGINDAIFQTDKYVFGTYLFRYDKVMPRVEILITKRNEDDLWANPDLDAKYAVLSQLTPKSLTPTTANTATPG